MKVKFLLFASLECLMLFSCNSEKEAPNTDIEVARAFINSILKNNFKEAERFLLKEETNEQYLNRFKEYEAKSKESDKYKDATIIINEITPVNDSVSIINYSNSFKRNKSNKLKMVRLNGRWLVDLKYTFSGNL